MNNDTHASEELASEELDASTLMSSHRTALSFERTSMSADNTQMAVLRTSLSLIGFGFTIFKFFQELGKSTGLQNSFAPPARNLGLTLVILGVALLVSGLFNHYFLMKKLRGEWQALYDGGLLKTPPTYKTSPNMVVSALLLLAGLLVLLGIIARTGPFR